MQRMKNKVCVVTGAARGIGYAIAKRLKNEGATVILTDKDVPAGEKAANELNAKFIKLDVANEADWKAISLAIPVADVVVNNAGITGFEESPAPQDPENAALEDWRRVHQVNLDGTFLGCRYAIGAMKEAGKGAIINISSRSGMVGIPAAAAYASSKAAIRNHSKSVALYCAQHGWDIRCNSIHPAAILTDIWEPMLGTGPDRAERMAALVADTPMKRFGEADEVAATVAFLASDEARYITGTEITIDGGLLAGSAASPSRE